MTKKREYYTSLPPHLQGCLPEQALCHDFIEEAQHHGWHVYPEYPESRFDLYLVAEADCTTRGVRPGVQVGVHAKMHANIDLLGQLQTVARRDRYRHRRGPDYIAALVPGRAVTQTEHVVGEAIRLMGLGFFYMFETHEGPNSRYNRKRANLRTLDYFGERQHAVADRLPLPELEWWTEPGVPSPTPLTAWQLRTLRFIIEFEKAEVFDYLDFQKNRQNIALWLHSDWVVQAGHRGPRKRVIYKLNPNSPKDRPDLKMPEVFKRVREIHGKQQEVGSAESSK